MPSLKRDEAVARAELLRVHEYQIDLDLRDAATSDDFGSVTVIRFTCIRPGAETFLEVKPDRVESVTVNGVELDAGTLVDNRLPLVALAAENEIVVRARMAYSNTGEGLHRYRDPEDGATYLYAQSFLDDAQRIFPCFDQPDLKATVRLAVSAPPDWEVAGNASLETVADGRWEFAATQPIPPYLVSLIAGPYHAVRDSHDGIPLALYCRRSLGEHLDKDAHEIFDVTRRCFDRYHDMFGYRYPFGKYDQAFVPEFNAGAMENAGLVTLRDEYVFRSAVADSERALRALIVAHEMAHMWFGDLVTMRWWEDLWLNESFAEYMAYRVAVEATDFTQAWIDFAVGRKGWGYADDQRPSTHPVAPESIVDSSDALTNFDGISYAKGAAVLRQLAVWIGDEAFLDGLRTHIATHAYGNASLADLLSALSAASGRDLSEWAQVWLRRAQVNTLVPVVTVDSDGRYESVEVLQTAPQRYPTLRPHRIGVAVYADGSRRDRVEVDLEPSVDSGRTAIPALVGQPRGDLLLLNDGDLTYAKIRLDPASAASLTWTLPGVRDPLARALVWASVVDAVRDAELPAGDLVALCAAALPTEVELTVFRDVVRFAAGSAVDRFLPPSQQGPARAALGAACLAALESAAPGGSLQLVAARGYLACTRESDVERLAGWLAGKAPTGLEVDAELRWSILTRLAALGAVGRAEIAEEYDRDRTGSGAQHEARCRAAMPDADGKAEAWRIIVDESALSNRLIVAAAEGFWQAEQLDLTSSYVERYFAEMPAMAARRTPGVVEQVARAAFPRFAVDPTTVDRAEATLSRSDLTPFLRRVIVDLSDDLRRAVTARRVAGGDV